MPVEILSPQSRDEWLAIRGHTIGASEVAALFGEHPWMSAYELHCHKSGIVAPDKTENPAMRRGRYAEQIAADIIRDDHPDWIVKANPMPGGQFYRDLQLGLSSTPDILVTEPDKPGFASIQIKSVHEFEFKRKWKQEDGIVEPPLYVAIQAIQDAIMSGASRAYVGAIVFGFGIDLPIIEIPMNNRLFDVIKEKASAFWNGVRSGTPPAFDYERDAETIAKMYGHDDGTSIDLTGDNSLPDLAVRDAALAETIKTAEGERKAIKGELIAKMGSHAVAIIDGRPFATAKTVNRGAYEVKPTSYRQIRFVKESSNGRPARKPSVKTSQSTAPAGEVGF